MNAAGEGTHDPKRAVGQRAAALVQDGMVVGLGTGSTAACAIHEIGRRVRAEGLHMIGIPTSFSAAELGREAGLTVRPLADVDRVDLALDGADEVDPARNLIKGRGAAHVQEKIVEAAARRFVVLVDDSKLVQQLGERMPVPVEVLPLALRWVTSELRRLGAEPVLRTGSGKDGPVITDNGHQLLDARFAAIPDPAELARTLDGIPGVVGHGIFAGMADEVIVGYRNDGSVRTL